MAKCTGGEGIVTIVFIERYTRKLCHKQRGK